MISRFFHSIDFKFIKLFISISSSMLACMLLLSSCGVKRTISTPIILHDKAYHADSVSVQFKDTITLRINEISGDTVFIDRVKWRTIYKEVRDTIYIEKPVISTEYKPYIPTWVWYLVIVAVVIILLTVARIVFWIYRKIVLHL